MSPNQSIIDLRVRRAERERAQQREELMNIVRRAENEWRTEIERLRKENAELRALLERGK